MKYLKRLLIALVTLCMLSCGGGSRGTGDLSISGDASTKSGRPLQAATVTFLATGDSALTDSSGRFLIITSAVTASADFLVESEGLSVTTSGDNLTEDVSEIEVEIEIEESSTPKATQKTTIKKRRDDNKEDDQQSGGSNGDDNSGSGNSDDDRDDSNNSGSDDGGGNKGDNDDDDDQHGGNIPDDDSQDDSDDDSAGESDDNLPGDDSGSDDSDDDGQDSSGEVRIEEEGSITAITSDSLSVNGKTFFVNGSTRFKEKDSLSELGVGDKVEVRGVEENGILFASEVKFKD